MKKVVCCSPTFKFLIFYCHVQANNCLSVALLTLIRALDSSNELYWFTLELETLVWSDCRELLVNHWCNRIAALLWKTYFSACVYLWQFVHLHHGHFFHYFENKIISCPVYSASPSPASHHQLGGSQRGPARLGMKRRVHNLCAGMLIFKSKGQLPFHHGGGCGIFSALQMFMNNVCGQTPGWGWGRRDRGGWGEGKGAGGWEVGGGASEARWITRRGDLTGGVELCDHSKVLIISLTFSISPVMKENRWLHPGLCSPRNDSSKGTEPPRKNELWMSVELALTEW